MADPMTAERLAEIGERAEKATPGPWRTSMSGYSVKSQDADMPIVASNPWGVAMLEKNIPRWLGNGDFIAEARQDIPDLLDALSADQQEIAALREQIKQARGFYQVTHIHAILDAALAPRTPGDRT